jgi:hypothetical protein
MTTPHRIYGWLDSQLSIARHYGGCELNGKRYVIRYDLEGQPLEEVESKKGKVVKKRTSPEPTATDDLLRDILGELE